MFEYLFRYSPLHNIQSGVDYPSILVTTSDHDDRVVPAHSFKFTAEMQAKSSSKNPVLIRIETKAGHGSGKPISKRIEESADIWTFIMDQLGMEW
jgi:prolyl oligopeptidase